MTNRLVAAMAFAALVVSVLSLFVALSATEVEPARTTGDVAAATPAAEADDEPTMSSPPATTAGTSADAGTPSATVVAASTAAPAGPAVTTTPDAELPGTPAAFGPAAGTQLGVIGVAYDDWLNVRDVPNGEVVATLTLQLSIGGAGLEESALLVRDAAAEELFARIGIASLTATGRTRDLATSTWHEIQAGPVVGWASSNYLAPLSPSAQFDITAQVTADIDGVAAAETLDELVERIVATVASNEPVSRVRTVAPPGAFEAIIDIAVDVVGQPDDSIRGYRLLIAAHAAGDWMAAATDGDIATDAGPYALRSVMATPLCYSHRGISAAGVCN